MFAGKLASKRLSFPEKAIVSARRVPEGDFRDWSEITGWAAGIAAALKSQSPAVGRPVEVDDAVAEFDVYATYDGDGSA